MPEKPPPFWRKQTAPKQVPLKPPPKEEIYMPEGIDLAELWKDEEETSGLTNILLFVLIGMMALQLVLGLFGR